MKKTLLSWSSGKDSAWSLHVLRQNPAVDVLGLFTVLNDKHQRVAMHSTRLALLEAQAEAAGLPLETLGIPDSCSHQEYVIYLRKFK